MEMLSSFPSVQHLLHMISKAFELDAGVVGENLQSIAGTTPYMRNIGLIAPNDSYANFVLKTGEMCFVADLHSTKQCHSCAKYSVCTFITGIYQPIVIEKKTKGVVFLLASNNTQLQIIRQQLPDLNKYLATTATLISNVMIEKNERMTARELETLLNFLDYGVLTLDNQGCLKQCNSASEKLLDFKSKEVIGKPMDSFVPGTVLISTMDKTICDVKVRHPDCSLTFGIHPIYVDEQPVEYVVLVKSSGKNKKIFLGTKETEDKKIFNSIIGHSPAIQALKEKVRKFAVSDSTILILGETGTGKELLAQAIHDLSSRKNGPLLTINCSAVPESLLESELFGYEDGTFTGAKKGGKPGKFQLAHNGIMVLDEIGDMPLPLQAKLLRVLENRLVEKLGARKPEPVNIRIIASTNRNLKELMATGQFRADLFFRLNVIPLHVPPLRERKSDIPLLVDNFLELFRKQTRSSVLRLDEQIMELLTNYNWPGNVRELKNTIEYIINTENGETASKESLPPDFLQLERISRNMVGSSLINSAPPIIKTRHPDKATVEKALLIYGVTTYGKQKAADYLGLSLSTLYRLITKLEIY